MSGSQHRSRRTFISGGSALLAIGGSGLAYTYWTTSRSGTRRATMTALGSLGLHAWTASGPGQRRSSGLLSASTIVRSGGRHRAQARRASLLRHYLSTLAGRSGRQLRPLHRFSLS